MFTLLLAALLAAPPLDPAGLQSGDILLQTSQSAQALAIAWVTKSVYTHVGMVERTGDRAFVIEAIHPVRRTPLAAWLARGVGGHATALRSPGLDDAGRAAVVAAAAAYLGRPYDLTFSPGDESLYCSELVHLAYAAIGVDVGALAPLDPDALAGPPARKLLRARWRRHPACRGATSLDDCLPALAATPVVTPASLAADPRLVLVGTSYLRPR